MFQAAQPKSNYTLRTLNPHQNATLVTMTDLIIPETDTPGAKAVRVNEFIDLILTEWAHDDERQRFLAGLDDVDKRSNAIFAKEFRRCLARPTGRAASRAGPAFCDRPRRAGAPSLRSPSP